MGVNVRLAEDGDKVDLSLLFSMALDEDETPKMVTVQTDSYGELIAAEVKTDKDNEYYTITTMLGVIVAKR
jgi:hypothetical protein